MGAQFVAGTDLAVGYYTFDSQGRLERKNGPQDDGYFYVNGIRQSCYQLVEYEGYYYFINDGHKIAKNCRLYMGAQFVAGTDLDASYYNFDANGRLVVLNGPQPDGYFYRNGIRLNCYQLVEYDDAYYFIYNAHKIIKNRRIYLSQEFVDGTKFGAGYYNFGADGRMLESYENLVDGVENNRDIGNWTTIDGKVIKTGLLIRGPELDGAVIPDSVITDAGIDYLVNTFGVKTQMDLRSPECGGKDILGDNVAHKYYDVLSYKYMFTDTGKERMKNVFADLAEESNYPIYLNCSYGQDRTGSVCYVLEAVLGLSEADIKREYSLAQSYVGFNNLQLAEIFSGLSEYGQATLQENAIAYLLDCGITADQIASLQHIYLG